MCLEAPMDQRSRSLDDPPKMFHLKDTSCLCHVQEAPKIHQPPERDYSAFRLHNNCCCRACAHDHLHIPGAEEQSKSSYNECTVLVWPATSCCGNASAYPSTSTDWCGHQSTGFTLPPTAWNHARNELAISSYFFSH